MFKDIIQTFSSRLATMLSSFLLLVLTTRLLGNDGRGIIALFTTAISFFVLFTGFLGGPALTFMASRREVHSLLGGILKVQLLLLIPFSLFIWFSETLSVEMTILACLGGLLLGWVTQIQNVLIGRNQLKEANMLNLLQVGGVLIICTIVFLFPKYRMPWVYGLASLFTFIFLVIYALKMLGDGSFKWRSSIAWRLLWREGWRSQLSNLIQFGNYRMSFYFLAWFVSNGSVGLFSVAVALAEAVWLFGRSISSVLLAKISSGQHTGNPRTLVNKAIPVSAFISMLGLIILVFIPQWGWNSIFNKEVQGLPSIMMLLAPGIWALSIQMPISHYFSGKGMFLVNARAAAFGFFPGLILHFILVPNLFGSGAALATSTAYVLSTLWACMAFYREK